MEFSLKNGQHPYIHDFTVNLNGRNLNYEVAYVPDSLYDQKGKIQSVDIQKFKQSPLDYFFVYHFKANFKKGLNIVKHTYKYNLSGSVDYRYDFEYILSAASRWKGGKIEDFTLNVDLGPYESFYISKGFFKNASDWKVEGDYKVENIAETGGFHPADAVLFHSKTGKISFQKISFEPKAELFVYATTCFSCSVSNGNLPYSFYQDQEIQEPENELDRKILRNLPYARRGQVFKNPELRKFYESQKWYMPDKNFRAENAVLSKQEEDWARKFR